MVEFLDAALASGGKVLVNCHLGVSRSAACVLAYLLTRHHMTQADAMDKVMTHTCTLYFQRSENEFQVRRHRLVRPNEGFLRQLTELERQLRTEHSHHRGR